jgi:hypothetical protein
MTCTQRVLFFAAISAAFSAAVTAGSITASAATAHTPKVAGRALYPNPSMTRGKAETLNPADLTRTWPCPAKLQKPSCSYSQAHRSVPATVKRRIYFEYGVNPKDHPPGEIDHFYPLCAGGSNDISNLWFQPETNVWNGKNYGFHQKDDLEAWVCQQVKAGQLDPREAFNKMTADWIKFYEEVKPGHQTERIE